MLQLNRNTSGLKYEPKLNPEAVARIREIYAYGSRDVNLRTLAAEYGVSINTIHSVILNKTWKCKDYAERLIDHPVQEKRRWRAMMGGYMKASNMYSDFLAAKNDPNALATFFKTYGK